MTEVKAHCDDCDRVRTITPTGKRRNPDRGTDTWWRIIEHWDERTGQPCPGSGRLV